MLSIVIGVTLFVVPQIAAEVSRSKILVIDDGENQEKVNGDVSIHQRIISSTDKDMTVKVDFKNYLYKTTQISLVLDNSYSMWSENKLTNSKEGIVNLVNTLFEDINNLEMSVVTYDGVKVAMGSDKTTIINGINNITAYTGVTTKTGLTYAQETFNRDDVNKYVILFTDGEEGTGTEITNLKNKKITLFTAYYGSAKAATVSQYSSAGKFYTILSATTSNINTVTTNIKSQIQKNMVKEVTDVQISDVFAPEISSNFTTEIVTRANVGTVVLNNSGYTWTIDKLEKETVGTFTYKITMKNNIDRNIMYNDFNINSSMNVSYKNPTTEETENLANENSPVINITETYTLQVKAVNKKYEGLNVKGFKFKIEQLDSSNNVVRTEEVETDANGEITIDDLTEVGTYKYRITQVSSGPAYELSDTSKQVKVLTITKDATTGAITASSTDQDDVFTISQNSGGDVTTATFKLDPKQFVLNLNKIDEETNNKLSGAQFTLKEPSCDSIPSGTTVVGTTNAQGKAVITGEVAGSGTFTYTLVENKAPTGYYENTSSMDLKITFDNNGNPTNLTTTSNKILSDSTTISGNNINITATNKMLDYKLKIQAYNDKYPTIAVKDLKIKVTGKNSNGTTIYEQEATTAANGTVELNVNKSGTVTYTIEQISVPSEYNKTANIVYTINRNFSDNKLTLTSPTNDENIVLDDTNKVLSVKLFVSQKTFDFKVNMIDKDYPGINLEGTVGLNQSERRDNLTGITTNGNYTFTADVICKTENADGTYTTTYSLEQKVKPEGYQAISGKIQVKVTFDANGKVINAESMNTNYVDIVKYDREVEVNLKNERQTYSVVVTARNNNYKTVTIPDVKVKVKALSEGTQFYESAVLTTGENGQTLQMTNFKQDGIVEFQIEEISVPTGYKTANGTAYAQYDYRREILIPVNTGNSDNIKVDLDGTNKIININIYLEVQTFKVQISKYCDLLPDTLIADATFSLTQPSIGNVRRNTVQAKTVLNEVLEIEGEVAGSGLQEYTLKEIGVPKGYENNGVTLKLNITFKNDGRIQSITTEETHNIDDSTESDESTDYLRLPVEKDFVSVGQVQNANGQDVIPISVENDQEEPKIEIKVANKNYTSVGVSNTKVNIIGKDNNSNFYNKTLKTNEDGIITIYGVTNTGDFDFETIATEVPLGYNVQTEKTIAYLNKNVETTEITERVDVDNVTITNRTIRIYLYLEPTTFEIEISKFEETLGDRLIPNVEFELTQPNITETKKRNVLKQKTVTDEKLVLNPELPGEGTYQYALKETVPSGYVDNKIQFTLNITFDSNGKITNAEKNNDESTIACSGYVELKEHTDTKVPLNITNVQKDYSITVEMINTNYRKTDKTAAVTVEGAKVKVIGKTEDGTTIYESDILETNENGLVTFMPLTQKGDVIYTVKTISVPTGYIAPSDNTFKINKDELTTNITVKESNGGISVDNQEKDIHVSMYLEQQTFEIEINKKDSAEEDVLVANAEFNITQPNFTNRARKSITGKTKLNERLVLTGEVPGEGKYTYKISETVPEGYTTANKTTNVEVEFNSNGTVKNAECKDNTEGANIDTQRTGGSKLSVNIINTKIPYQIIVKAVNEKHTSMPVKDLKLRVIGRDSNNNVVYDSSNFITDEKGNITIQELRTVGDVTYQIVQLDKIPTEYNKGDTKEFSINVNRLNNEMTLLTQDTDVQLDNRTKRINVTLRIPPKTFKISTSKLDYDDKVKGVDTFVNGARFTVLNPNKSTTSFTTADNQVLDIEAEVGGEGTFEYVITEMYPTGYQEFRGIVTLTVTFNEDGEIIDDVQMETKWETWSIKKDNTKEWVEVENTKALSGLTGHTKNSISMYITNVKKEYSLIINTVDDKYSTPVSDVYMQVTAKNENDETIYREVVKTERGRAVIPEFRQIGKVYFTIEEVEVPTCYNHFNEKHLAINKSFPSRNATIDIENTSNDINAEVGYADESKIKAPINSPTSVSMTIVLNRKTFDINLTKVDVDSSKILLPGARFTLTQSNGERAQSEITNQDGELIFSADIEGIAVDDVDEEKEYIYTLKENKEPDGYILEDRDVQICVTINKNDEITNVRIVDDKNLTDEVEANRKKDSIDILSKNSKRGKSYNIQFTKKYEDEPVKGSTYKMTVSAESGENLTIKDITNKRGQIKVSKLPGSKKIVIHLTEIKAPEGYDLDSEEKTVTVRKSLLTGNIEVVEEETSSDLRVSFDEDSNTIFIELNTRKPKDQDNIIRIVSVDKNNEKKLVAYAIVEVTLPTNEVIQRETNSAGCIYLDPPEEIEEGTYQYKVRVLDTPEGYLDYQGGEIVANITYNSNGKITDTSLENPNEYADGYYETNEENTIIHNIATIVEKNTPEETIKLNLLKKGENDEVLKNVSFDITTTTTIGEKEVVATSNETTDENGKIEYDVLSGDNIVITLKETKTQEEYRLDSNPKDIVLRKVDNELKIVSSQTDSEIDASIEEDKLNVTVYNRYKPAKVIMQLIYQSNNSDNAIKLRGIHAKVKELTNDREYDVVTDESGEINFEDLPIEQEGVYNFVITELSAMDGCEVPQVDEDNPVVIQVKYFKNENGEIEVEDILYRSRDDIIQGISYTNYTSPEDYILYLKVVFKQKITEESSYDINVYKVDKDDILTRLPGATFRVNIDYLNGTGVEFDETTDEKGNIKVTLPFAEGRMKVGIQELIAPEGYSIDESEEKVMILNKDSEGRVTIETDFNSYSLNAEYDNSELNIFVKDTKISVEEEKYEFDMEIYKIDKDTTLPLKDVQFKVTLLDEATGRKLEEEKTVVTDKDGKAELTMTDIESEEEYYYQIEETTPEGYKEVDSINVRIRTDEEGKVSYIEQSGMNNALKQLQVIDGVAKLIIQNEKIEMPGPEPSYDYYIELDKIDKETKGTMEDVEFKITEIDEGVPENQKEITTFTNEDGQIFIRISGVKANQEYIYNIDEVTPEGYKDIDTITVRVTFDENGRVETFKETTDTGAVIETSMDSEKIKLVVQNEKDIPIIEPVDNSYYIDINKFDKETNGAIEGVKFVVTQVNEDTRENIGNSIIVTTNENGRSILEVNNIKGQEERVYKVEEIKTEGYKAIDEIYIKVCTDNNGNVETVEQLDENNALTEIENTNNDIMLMIVNEKETEPEAEPEEYEYNIEINKIDKDTEEAINDVKFRITEVDEETKEILSDSAILTTDEEGKLSLKVTGIKANEQRVYVVEETALEGYRPIDYMMIKVYTDSEGKVEKAEQLTENEALKELNTDDNRIILVVQNEREEIPEPEPEEYEYNIEINKIDKETEEAMGGVKFRITEVDEETKEILSDSAILTTDEEGKLSLKVTGIKANEQRVYVVEETALNGYKPIDYMMIKVYTDSEGKVEKAEQLTENEALKELNTDDNRIILVVQNEREEIPEPEPEEYKYKIEINKTDKDTKKAMEGVRFRITEIEEETQEAKGESIILTTNEEGKVLLEITGIKSKENRVYVIEEAKPDGYKEIKYMKIKVYTDIVGNVNKVEQIGKNNALTECKASNNIVKLAIENEKEEVKKQDEPKMEVVEKQEVINKTESKITEKAPEEVEEKSVPVVLAAIKDLPYTGKSKVMIGIVIILITSGIVYGVISIAKNNKRKRGE